MHAMLSVLACEHACPHEPQFVVVVTSVSQPSSLGPEPSSASQSSKPSLQLGSQLPFEQSDALAWERLQECPHEPQSLHRCGWADTRRRHKFHSGRTTRVPRTRCHRWPGC